MVQLHFILDGSLDCPMLPLHVAALYQPSMGRLSLDAKHVKVFAQYQG